MRAQLAINNKGNVSNTPHLQVSKQTTTLDFLPFLFLLLYCNLSFDHLQNKEDTNKFFCMAT